MEKKVMTKLRLLFRLEHSNSVVDYYFHQTMETSLMLPLKSMFSVMPLSAAVTLISLLSALYTLQCCWEAWIRGCSIQWSGYAHIVLLKYTGIFIVDVISNSNAQFSCSNSWTRSLWSSQGSPSLSHTPTHVLFI